MAYLERMFATQDEWKTIVQEWAQEHDFKWDPQTGILCGESVFYITLKPKELSPEQVAREKQIYCYGDWFNPRVCVQLQLDQKGAESHPIYDCTHYKVHSLHSDLSCFCMALKSGAMLRDIFRVFDSDDIERFEKLIEKGIYK